MDLNALEDFRLVATHGGFGRASRASGRSKATLSRRVAELEVALGVRLVERGARGPELTETGRLLLNRTEGPLHEVAEAVAAARDGLATPRGRLRVAVPLLFSQLALGRIAARFLATHPEVELEAETVDRHVNLVDEHFDVAVRVNPRKDSALVGRCFAKDRLVLAAAPSVRVSTRRAATPVRARAVVGPTYRDGEVWSALDGSFVVEPEPVLRLSSLLAVRDAIVAGAGVGVLPQSILGSRVEKGELVTWDVAGDDVELWVLHTSRRLQSPKVRAFVEFLCDEYANGSYIAPETKSARRR